MAIELNEFNVLKKEDIIFYLNNYCNLIFLAIENPKINFRDLHQILMKNYCVPQFMPETIFYNTIRVYEFLLFKQMFSYKYDSVFPDLKEDMIKDIKIPEKIFVNPEDEKKFSKKQILKFIRNAMNHNDSTNRELYHIVQSGDKLIIDIHLLRTKPIPFHVQIDMRDFIELEKTLVMSKYNPDVTLILQKTNFNFLNPNIGEELNKIVIRRYNFESGEKKDILSNILNLRKNGNIDIKNLSQITLNSSDYNDYELSISQKIKIQQDIEELCGKCNVPLNNKLLSYLVNNVTQFGSSKIYGLMIDYFFCDHYLGRSEKSLLDFQTDVIEYSNNAKNSYLKSYISSISDYDFMFYRAWDWDQFELDAYNVLLSYLLDTYIKDPVINISGKTIERSKIRDSFVHGRFYVGSFYKYRFFDSQNGRKNEKDINWSEIIKCQDLIKYSQSVTEELVLNPHINIPMKISNEPVNHVTCAFNSTTFVSLFYDFSLSDDLKFKKYVIYKFNHDGIFVADEEEKKYFLNQLSFLPENERMTYSEQINELINFNETEQKNNIKLK